MSEEAPPSSELPQLKSKKGTAIAVLVTIALVAVTGGVLLVRYMGKSERDREVKSYQQLVRCTFGSKPGAERPSLRYRRIELTALATDPLKEKDEAWPARCATYGHALYEAIKDAGKLKKDAKDVAYWAETFAKVVKDPHSEEDVYAIVDQMWTEAQKENYADLDPGDVKPPPQAADPMSVDGLPSNALLSKARVTLADLGTDRVPEGALHLLADARAHADKAELCTIDLKAASCKKLPDALASEDRGLRLFGAAEDGALPLLFASPVGEGGVFRADGESIAALPTYGGLARADGTAAVVGYDRAKSKFAIVRARPGAAHETSHFALKGVTDDRQLLLVHDQLVYVTEEAMLTQRIQFEGATPLNPPIHVGAIAPVMVAQDPIRACRTPEAMAILVRTVEGDVLAFDNGEHWAPLRRLGGAGGVLSCHGREAFVTRRNVFYEGSSMKGDVTIEQCGADDCAVKRTNLEEFFRDVREMVPVNSALFATGELDGKLLAVWRAGKKGGIRMRLAAADQIAQAPDVVLFDDLVHEGVLASKESSLFELRLITRPGFAILLLSTTAGVHLLKIDASGKVAPLAVTG